MSIVKQHLMAKFHCGHSMQTSVQQQHVENSS